MPRTRSYVRRALRATAIALAAVGCAKDPTSPSHTQPYAPSTLNGRVVQVQGTVEVGSPNVTFRLWDSGTVDGDIVSLNVNGQWVVQNYTLTGTKKDFPVTLNRSGYSYVVLYAHNEGSIPPNTAALSINDGVSEKNIILSADLTTNGAYNIVIR